MLSHIASDLRSLARPIDSLSFDPENARRHPESNLRDIEASLKAHGQMRPLVVKGNRVMAGNGTLEAAKRLGWSHIACVEYEAPEVMAKAYGLADNRASDRATYDQVQLEVVLKEMEAAGLLEATGYGDVDLSKALDEAGSVLDSLEAAVASMPAPQAHEDDEDGMHDPSALTPRDKAILGERESCARVAESMKQDDVARAIRGRGDPRKNVRGES